MIYEISEYSAAHFKYIVFVVLRLTAIWFLIGGFIKRYRQKQIKRFS